MCFLLSFFLSFFLSNLTHPISKRDSYPAMQSNGPLPQVTLLDVGLEAVNAGAAWRFPEDDLDCFQFLLVTDKTEPVDGFQ